MSELAVIAAVFLAFSLTCMHHPLLSTLSFLFEL